MNSVSYAVETPFHSGVELLIEALNQELDVMTPPEFNNHISVEDMDNPQTTLIVARNKYGIAIACGAIVRHPVVAEIKRMYTNPEFRGKGISSRILTYLTDIAISEGYNRMVLETGVNYDSACALYRKHGWRECGPVLNYLDNPYSLFFEKFLE